MILVDASQVVFAAMFTSNEIIADKSGKVNKDLFRHIVLNMIAGYKRKYGAEYGSIVICYDAGNNWRKKVFPYYKARRSIDREEDSKVNWDEVFEMFGELRVEFAESLPYKQVWVDGAEGDDIIAVLSRIEIEKKESDHLFTEYEKHMIISSDGDFKQLHRQGVEQWNLLQKKIVKEPNPARFLLEKILRGDKGDGVPNILSPDDVFVRENTRQKPLRETRIDKIIQGGKIQFSELNGEEFANFKRNKAMISLQAEDLPEAISNEIMKTYNEFPVPGKNKLYNYIIKHRLNNLLDSITDF